MSGYDLDAFDAFEAAGWGTKDAVAYDALAGRVTSRVADPLLDAVRAGPGTRMLDVATGPGYVAELAAARGAQPIGLDLSDTMLTHARQRLPHLELVHGDVTALPFPVDSFDAVVGAFVLLHLGRPELAAAEAARVLVPGGRAAFSVWDEPSRSRWLGVLLDAVHDAGARPPAEVPPGPPIFELADDVAFTRLLRGAGLDDVAVDTVEFTLHVDSGDELWTGLVEGSVRVRPMVLLQTAEMQQTIRAHFDEGLDDYRAAAGFDVPVSVKLGSGLKP